MKHFLPAALTMMLSIILGNCHDTLGQGRSYQKLGKATSFIKQLHASDSVKSNARRGILTHKLDAEGTLTSALKQFSKEGSKEVYTGLLTDDKNSNVHIRIENGIVSGTVVSQAEKKAFRYKTRDNGDLYLEETDIDSVMCIGMAKAPGVQSAKTAAAAAVVVPQYESRPGAPAVIYLDFDGEYVVSSGWNGGDPINAAASSLTAEDIRVAWSIISEDFAPYNINVTTKRSVYDARPLDQKTMCIFTTTNFFGPTTGGIANTGSFGNNYFSPCWVFNEGAKGGGETGAHELGHVMGLHHDGYFGTATTTGNEYYPGHANGIWAPIMGGCFTCNVGQFSKGEYLNADNSQDDVERISSPLNKFGFATDEAGSVPGNARYLVYGTTGVIDATANAGVISKAADVDVFRFKTNGGSLNVSVAGASPVTISTGTFPITNLDPKLQLLNASGGVVATSDPAGTATASITATLAAGVYYLSIDGVGSGNPLNTGYSDYGSAGRYTITGTIQNSVSTDFSVGLLSPEMNAFYIDAEAVTFTSTAKSSPNAVTKVEYFEGTTATKLGESTVSPYTFTKTNFTEGNHTVFARATNSAGQTVTSASVTITVYKSVAGETTGNFNNGIVYDYYEATYTTLPDFTTLTPVYRGLTRGISLDPNAGTVQFKRQDNFALRFKGYVYITDAGLHKFTLNSDDGSKLLVDNKLIIANDGVHAATVKTGYAALLPGYHQIEVDYFEASSGQVLELSILNILNSNTYFQYYRKDLNASNGLSIEKQLLQGVKYEYNEGTYTTLPVNFNSLTYKSTGGLSNYSLTIPARRADNFAVRYSGYIYLPFDGEWVYYLKSDDGSKLYVDDQLVISNDGVHDNTVEKKASVWMLLGYHKIRIEYFENAGGESLSLSYSGPGTYKTAIPNSALTRDALSGETIGYLTYPLNVPDNGVEAEWYDQGGQGYSYVDGTPGNQYGLYRNDDVDINVGPSFMYPNYVVVFNDPGDVTEYTVNAAASGTYDIVLTVTTGNSAGDGIFIFVDNYVYGMWPIPVITDGSTWQTIVVKNVAFNAGKNIITLSPTLHPLSIDNFYFAPASGYQRKGSDELSATAFKANAYPNPFESKINIDLSGFEKVESLRLYDLRGVVLWQAAESELSQAEVSFDKNVAAGMYLLEIRADQKTSRMTIVKK